MAMPQNSEGKSSRVSVRRPDTRGVVHLTPKQKGRKAYELRIQGRSWSVIAEMVGYSTAANAQRAAKKFMDRLPAPLSPEENATLHGDRLEDLLSIARESLNAKNPSPAMIRTANDILKQIMSLQGTADRDRKVREPADDEFQRVVRKILALGGLSWPDEGNPFASDDEDIILAEVVDEDEPPRREVLRFIPPSSDSLETDEPDAEDVIALTPAEALARFGVT